MTENYTTLTVLAETTDGDWCYIATHPELPGCFAQGETPEEARADLEYARADYIASLKEDGVPIPTRFEIEEGDLITVDVHAVTVIVDKGGAYAENARSET
jgi:predicted RNase H-like HicB family nuclease